MDFSVALFGHYKTDPTGVNVKRAQPGDIVAWKPLKESYKWTDLEKKLFLIVTIKDIEAVQMEALCEAEYDLDSYKEYVTPLSYEEWSKKYYPDMSIKDKEKKYIVYKDALKTKCDFPVKYWRKRRFAISLSTLEEKDVDTDKMIDTKVEYSASVDITKIEIYDKLRQRVF